MQLDCLTEESFPPKLSDQYIVPNAIFSQPPPPPLIIFPLSLSILFPPSARRLFLTVGGFLPSVPPRLYVCALLPHTVLSPSFSFPPRLCLLMGGVSGVLLPLGSYALVGRQGL